jgi:hypothetical protein
MFNAKESLAPLFMYDEQKRKVEAASSVVGDFLIKVSDIDSVSANVAHHQAARNVLELLLQHDVWEGAAHWAQDGNTPLRPLLDYSQVVTAGGTRIALPQEPGLLLGTTTRFSDVVPGSSLVWRNTDQGKMLIFSFQHAPKEFSGIFPDGGFVYRMTSDGSLSGDQIQTGLLVLSADQINVFSPIMEEVGRQVEINRALNESIVRVKYPSNAVNQKL